VALVAAMLFLQPSTPVYACTNEFNPTPAPTFIAPTVAPGTSNAPATQPPTGYIQPDMGHTHVDPGTRITYTWCPPASGKHYNVTGLGPIPARVYGPDEATIPQGWVHNMEHGALVLLYKCPGPSCDDAGQAALEALRARWPLSPICKFPPDTVGPVITRFDDMPYPYAAVVWDAVLPMQTLDEKALFQFFADRAERFNIQEPRCAAPTPTAAPATPTPVPSATAAPTTAPTAAPTAPAASSAPSAS
jgi:hypothetical protein